MQAGDVYAFINAHQEAMEQTIARAQGSPTSVKDIAWLIEAEYREMPGMRLTSAQVGRLWNLSPEACRQVLDLLVNSGRLARDYNDRFWLYDDAL